MLEIVCLNAAGSVKESTASSVRTCFIAVTVKKCFALIAEHLLNALIIPTVETNFAKNANRTFVMNVRRDFVQTVHGSVDVVSIQFVTVVQVIEYAIVRYAIRQCALGARCNVNSARIRSVISTVPWTALTVQYASRLARLGKDLLSNPVATIHHKLKK